MPLVVEAQLGQGVVVREGLDQCHHALAADVVGLDVEADDGRVLGQHLGDGQGHGVVRPRVGQAEGLHVAVGPQGLGEADQVLLRDKVGSFTLMDGGPWLLDTWLYVSAWLLVVMVSDS